MWGFLSALGHNWIAIIGGFVAIIVCGYVAFLLRNIWIAIIAVVLVVWFFDHQNQYAVGYNQRVTVEVAERTKILAARIATLESVAAQDKARADADAAAIKELQAQIDATPENKNVAIPRAATKRIGKIK